MYEVKRPAQPYWDFWRWLLEFLLLPSARVSFPAEPSFHPHVKALLTPVSHVTTEPEPRGPPQWSDCLQQRMSGLEHCRGILTVVADMTHPHERMQAPIHLFQSQIRSEESAVVKEQHALEMLGQNVPDASAAIERSIHDRALTQARIQRGLDACRRMQERLTVGFGGVGISSKLGSVLREFDRHSGELRRQDELLVEANCQTLGRQLACLRVERDRIERRSREMEEERSRSEAELSDLEAKLKAKKAEMEGKMARMKEKMAKMKSKQAKIRDMQSELRREEDVVRQRRHEVATEEQHIVVLQDKSKEFLLAIQTHGV